MKDYKMNKNWKDHWKLLAAAKENTAIHHIQYCLMKAYGAKANNKVEIAHALLRKAFTPSAGSYYTVQRLISHTYYRKTIFDLDATLFFKDEVEEKAFKTFVSEVSGINLQTTEQDYMFLFVRQDISKEQQSIQAAHVAYKAGCMWSFKPDKTNFVLIGVENEEALMEINEICLERDHRTASFIESDLDNTTTAIAVHPMKEHQKRFLKKHKKLSFT